MQIFLLAAVYYLTGKMGLFLALPPGYASPLWPPTGIGIVALLLFGVNLWPGLYLGAFFVNFEHAPPSVEILAAGGIAIGNTLSIVLAAICIKKFLSYPKPFYIEKDIFLFLLMAGPLAGFISASWGVSTLYFLHEVHGGNFVLNWLNWFIGDATGGIIFSPLALIFSIQSRQYWLKSVTNVLLPLISFFVFVVIALNYFNKTEKEKLTSDFTKRSDIAFEFLQKDINSLQDLLISLQSFYESSQDVTQDEFKHFTKSLYVNRPEIQALAWISADSKNPDLFPVRFVEPTKDNAHLSRINFGASKINRKLIDDALAQKDTIVSGVFPLDSMKPREYGVYMLLAVARPKGVLLEVVNFNQVLKTISDFINDPSYRVVIEDIEGVSASSSTTLVDTWLTNPMKNVKAHFNPDFQWTSQIKIGNHFWKYQVQQDSTLIAGGTFRSIISLLASLLFTFLICALLIMVASRVIRTENIVAQKTLHLRELNVQLEKASQAKSEFLANMSHEIRTPLNVLLGMGELLEESPLNEEQLHYIDISKKAGENLLSIVNDILDISKIEAGSITLEKTEVDLPQLVKEVFDMFKIKAQEKDLHLSMTIDNSVRNIYLGDPTRIRQILSNLVSNAVKFTSTGSIDIRLTQNNDPTLLGNILFSVSDTGPGIPKDKISKLFQPFTQADSSITRKFGGTGLGLSICKRLTKMMAGDIQVKSELDKGSTFSFTLDLPFVRVLDFPTEKVNALHNVPRSHTSLKILVADDSSDNRTLIKAYLKDMPHVVLEAADGVEALSLYREEQPDLIMMDMQMPIMDGITAVQEIRKWEKENKLAPVPIWALTAYAMTNEIQKSLRAGCNLHLTKPIRRHDLLNHINALTH